MSSIELYKRDLVARQEVLRQYAARHDHWSIEEQLAIQERRFEDVEDAHVFALLLLRAFRSELDNRVPKEAA